MLPGKRYKQQGAGVALALLRAAAAARPAAPEAAAAPAAAAAAAAAAPPAGPANRPSAAAQPPCASLDSDEDFANPEDWHAYNARRARIAAGKAPLAPQQQQPALEEDISADDEEGSSTHVDAAPPSVQGAAAEAPAPSGPASPRRPADRLCVPEVKKHIYKLEAERRAAAAAAEAEEEEEAAEAAEQESVGTRTVSPELAAKLASGDGPGAGGSAGGSSSAGAERVLGVALAAAAGAAQQPKAQLKYTLQRGDSSDLTIALPTAAFSPVRWIQRAWEGVFDATSGLPAAKAVAASLALMARLPQGLANPVAGDWRRWADWATTTVTVLCSQRLPRQQPAAQPWAPGVLLLAECDKEGVDLLSASITCRSKKLFDGLVETNQIGKEKLMAF